MQNVLACVGWRGCVVRQACCCACFWCPGAAKSMHTAVWDGGGGTGPWTVAFNKRAHGVHLSYGGGDFKG